MRTPASRKAASAPGRRGLDRVGDRDEPGERAVDGHVHHRGTLAPQRVRLRRSRVGAMPSSRSMASLPSATARPSTSPRTPLPVSEAKPVAGRQRQAALLGGADDGLGQRMLAGALEGGGEAQDMRPRHGRPGARSR